MKNIKIINKSQLPLNEVMPIFRAAYQVVKPEIKLPQDRVVLLTLEHTRRRTWMCRWNRGATQSTARMLFAKPGKKFSNTSIGPLELKSMTEVMLAVSAWTFAAVLARPALGCSCARDALHDYRSNPGLLDGAISSARQLKIERDSDAFASAVFQGMKNSSLDHKLSQIEKKEKAWLRKLRLAETKLKSLRRSRSALLAADKRKRLTQEAQVAATALPPLPTQP